MTLRPIQLLATLALSAALPTSVLASTSGATAQPSSCVTCDVPSGSLEHAPDAGSTGTASLTDVDYYVDDDGDRYGTGDVAMTGTDATAPTGYSLTNDDCDDTDASVNPGAMEVCDGVDNDCSGDADDGLTFVDYYPDIDGDGYGDEAGTPLNDCEMPSNYVEDNTDCDDSSDVTYPGADEVCDGLDNDCDGTADEDLTYADYYPDTDGDGYGDAEGTAVNDCAAPSNYVEDNTDCDDTSDVSYPDAEEQCDGLDNNCDGTIDNDFTFSDWYPDTDGDGYGDETAAPVNDCAAPSGHVADNTDCDDGQAGVNPGEVEVCDSRNFDEDCNGLSEDEDPDATEKEDYAVDADGDGFGDGSTIEAWCDPPSGLVDEYTDCDDTNSQVYPGASEIPGDGINNDCDETTGDEYEPITEVEDYNEKDDGCATASAPLAVGAWAGLLAVGLVRRRRED